MPPLPTLSPADLAAACAEQARVLSGMNPPPQPSSSGLGDAFMSPKYVQHYAYWGRPGMAAPAGYWSDPHSDFGMRLDQVTNWQAGDGWVRDEATGAWFHPEAWRLMTDRRQHWNSDALVTHQDEPLWSGLSWGEILGHPWRYSDDARAWAESTRARFPYVGTSVTRPRWAALYGTGVGDVLPATTPYVPGGCPLGYIPGPNNSYCTWDWGTFPKGPDFGPVSPSGGLPSIIPPTQQGGCLPNQVQGPLGCIDPSQIPGVLLSNGSPCGSGYVAVGPYCLPAAFLPPDGRPSTTLPGPGPANACPNGGTDLFGVCLKPGDLPGLPAGLPPITNQGCPTGQVSIAGVCLPIAQPWATGLPVPPDFVRVGGSIVPAILAQLPPGSIPDGVLPPGIMLPGALPRPLPPNQPPPVLVCDKGCHPSKNGQSCVCPDTQNPAVTPCQTGSSRRTAGGPCVADGADQPASGTNTALLVGGALVLAGAAYLLLRPAATPTPPHPRY